jgi:hypothetical protein
MDTIVPGAHASNIARSMGQPVVAVCTHTGRPLGTPDFVAALEKSTLRHLAPRYGGRPIKSSSDSSQPSLTLTWLDVRGAL